MCTDSTAATRSLELTVSGVSLAEGSRGTVRLAVACHLVHAVDGSRAEVLAVGVSLQTHGVGGVAPPGDVMVRVAHQGRQLVRVGPGACGPTRASQEFVSRKKSRDSASGDSSRRNEHPLGLSL